MVDVVVYVSSVANARKHPRKVQCLESFAQGVTAAGDTVRIEWDYKYTPSRLAVILGWATTNIGGPNISLRKQIISEQIRTNHHTMCIDASCWKYLDNTGTYLRYSIGGPFYDRAEYANANSTVDKWLKIQQDLGVTLKPDVFNANGHVLICMQRDGGFAMKTLDPLVWLQTKITQVRKYTKRKIMIRPHPGDYRAQDFATYRTPIYQRAGITVIDPTQSRLEDNLHGAWAAVFFNSSASVAAVCQGVPIYVDDSSCVSWKVANHDLKLLNEPQKFDKQQWIQDLAAAHWSDEESRQGLIYQKFLPYLR